MSVASEITRLQNAKAALKTAINAKNDSSHQIDDETLEDYAGFVDLIHGALPAEYTELEYIESTGTQYIDTGIVPDDSTGFSLTYQLTTTSNDSFTYGAREGTNGRFTLGVGASKIYFGWGSMINFSSNIWSRNVLNKYNVKVNYKNSREATIDGGESVALNTLSATFASTTTIYIFGVNRSDSSMTKFSQKVYENIITRGTSIIGHFIPCKRNSDNAIGMYDKVSGTFFTNAGTGEFIAPAGTITTLVTKTITENGTYDAGDDDADGYSEVTVNVHEALPFGYKQLEYIESNYTQFIDTGIPLKTATDDVEVDFYVSDLSVAQSIFGARYSTTNRAYSLGIATTNTQWRPSFGSTTENTGTATVGRHVAFMSHNGGTLTVDGTQIISIGNASITTPVNCHVFAIKGNGSLIYYSACRIYSFKIWRSGALLMHLVPAIRMSDFEAGMYDKVSGTFFTNDGTGKFIIPSGQGVTLIAKGINVNGVYNASDDGADGYSQVIVNAKPEVVPQKDVNFYDYDGTILYSYTASEFAELTELPANPIHDGLTSEGWNWSLADAKAQVAAIGACDIGQMYVTDDGKTRLYCHFTDDIKSFYFGIAPNGTVVVDWGDESETDTLTGTSRATIKSVQHTYATAGDYVITLTVSSGTFAFYGTSNTQYIFRKATNATANIHNANAACLKKVEIGTDCYLGNYSFLRCYSLETITIPKEIVSVSGTGIFHTCCNLKHVTLPQKTSSVITSLSNYAFINCYALKSVCLPKSVTTLATYIFRILPCIERIVLPSISTISGNGTFYGDFSLMSVYLSSSLTSIPESTFYQCYNLTKLVIPATVTSIATKAFQDCYGMKEYHFKSTTPPTLDNADAFSNMQSDCVIYVPSASLNSYKTASNWSTYASQMVGE